MDALEKLVKGAGDAKAAENLTAIYISLGRELEQHLQDLRKSGHTKELDDVSQAFEVFLDRVTKRDAGNSYASLNWVGETYFSLGNGFDDGTGKSSAKATAYFKRATDAYRRVLEIAAKDPKFKEQPDSLNGIRLRLADCYRRSGSYDEAIKTILGVLRDKPMLLPAQVQAAETYQAQGAVDPKGYVMAITGSTGQRRGECHLGVGEALEVDHESAEVREHLSPVAPEHGRGPLSLWPGSNRRSEASQDSRSGQAGPVVHLQARPRLGRQRKRGAIRSTAQASAKRAGRQGVRPRRIQTTRCREHQLGGQVKRAVRKAQ